MKCYAVSEEYKEIGSILVWTDKGANHAKTMAHGTDLFCECEYIELRCRREPKADNEFNEIHISDMGTDKEIRIMWNLGWHELDYSWNQCPKCERYEWSSIPESEYDKEKEMCLDCLTKERE